MPEFTLWYVLHTWCFSTSESHRGLEQMVTSSGCHFPWFYSHFRNRIVWILGRDEQSYFRFWIGIQYSLLICSTRTDTVSSEHHQTCNISAVGDCGSWHPEQQCTCCKEDSQAISVDSSSPSLWVSWSTSACVRSNTALVETNKFQADCRRRRRCIVFIHWFGRHSSHDGFEGKESPVFLQGRRVLFYWCLICFQ